MLETQALQTQAYQYLFQAILDNQFSDGIMYSESQLTERLGISRTPIRSALQRLQMEGYIDIYPSRGFRLHKITAADLREAFQTCIANEAYSAFSLMQSPDCQTVCRQLEACIQRQRGCAGRGDIEAFMEEDRRFHGTIIDSLQNSSFQMQFTIYRYKIRAFLEESLSQENGFQGSIQGHIHIVRAITEKDSSHILELLQEHHNDFRAY